MEKEKDHLIIWIEKDISSEAVKLPNWMKLTTETFSYNYSSTHDGMYLLDKEEYENYKRLKHGIKFKNKLDQYINEKKDE